MILWSPHTGSRYATVDQNVRGARRSWTGSKCQSIAALSRHEGHKGTRAGTSDLLYALRCVCPFGCALTPRSASPFGLGCTKSFFLCVLSVLCVEGALGSKRSPRYPRRSYS